MPTAGRLVLVAGEPLLGQCVTASELVIFSSAFLSLCLCGLFKVTPLLCTVRLLPFLKIITIILYHVLKVTENVEIFIKAQFKMRPRMAGAGIRHHVAHVCICSPDEFILVSSLCWRISFEKR